ncbi:HEAT repeat domain-containing protein [Nodosilinea sp. FACHB-13]|uniref:HEAT repeat domain-containing protein n=1 Tax=Cyanophyceae TaxID=3028117 RepID=UPI00168596CC|nr:HEAT repeat domain-containing protein [Nodosilinea sp. FACHB-13]
MSSFDQFAVSSSPSEAARTTVAKLGAGDFHDRWEQSRQVADLGDAALDDLLAMLQDSECDWEARWFAARALGEFDRPEVIAALVNTFATTTDEDLRQAMAAALTQIGPGAIAALGEQLAQPELRPAAVQALARIHHPATIPWLKLAMADARSPVRATALDALSAFADLTLLPMVQQGLADPAAAVRAAAVRGLLALRLGLPAQQLIDALTPLLGDADERVAQQATYALGRLSSAAAAAPLLQLLQAPGTPEALQIFAVQALSWQNTATALEGLIQAWDWLELPARLTLVQGLAAVASNQRSRATAALANWLQLLPPTADNSTLRRHLVLALGQVGDSVLESELRSLLHDPDPGVQLHAEAALRQLQTQSV